MTLRFPGRFCRGVTLIELLCVFAIIAILAGMLLGPAGRVLKRMRTADWEDKASLQFEGVRDRLRKRYQGQTDFPAATLDQLHKDGTLLSSQVRFLRDKRVVFVPFSGADPTNLVIVSVRIESGFLTTKGTMELTKADIVSPPD